MESKQPATESQPSSTAERLDTARLQLAETKRALERAEVELLGLDPDKDAKAYNAKERQRDELASRVGSLEKRTAHLEREAARTRLHLSPAEMEAKRREAAELVRKLRAHDSELTGKAAQLATEITRQLEEMRKLSSAALDLERQVFLASPATGFYFAEDWAHGSAWLSAGPMAPLAAAAKVVRDIG